MSLYFLNRLNNSYLHIRRVREINELVFKTHRQIAHIDFKIFRRKISINHIDYVVYVPMCLKLSLVILNNNFGVQISLNSPIFIFTIKKTLTT